MATRKALNSVVHNFLGTFVSRYSAFKGYWLFGFLVADDEPLRLDLLAPDLDAGGSAAAVAAISQGWMDSPLLIDLPGGRLSIEWAGPGHPVIMTGPATRVYEGQVRL